MRPVPNILHIALTAAVLAFAAVALAQTPAYTVVDLGTLGGPCSFANAINSFGHVAGTADVSGNGPSCGDVSRGIVWFPKPAYGLTSGLHAVGTFGGVYSAASDLNDAGRVVGCASLPDDGAPFVNDDHAFVWRAGVMADLGILHPQAWQSCATSINQIDQIIGWESFGFGPGPLAWLPSPAFGLPAGMSDLTPVLGDWGGLINDNNSVGAMVGAIHSTDVSGEMRAMVWVPTAMYSLPAGLTQLVLDDTGDSEALAVNESGQIVGYRPGSGNTFQAAFQWENGVLTDLPLLDGGDLGAAVGLNNSGEIVGWSAIATVASANCIWKNGSVSNLDLELPAESGIQLWDVRSINDAGQIVGYGKRLDNGKLHALLLNPVCPRLLPPYREPEGVAKNRYLSLGIAFTGPPAAIKVTLVDVQGFPSFNGEVRWVSPPTTYTDAPNASLNFVAAQLQCSPYFSDWGGFVPLHVFGAEVVPGSTYRIEIVRQPCPGSTTGDLETSLPTTFTTAKWGDIVSPFGAGQPNFGDIAALVDAFKNSPVAPNRVRAQLRPNVPNPTAATNFQDVAQCVEAFKGKPYPFAGPGSCAP